MWETKIITTEAEMLEAELDMKNWEVEKLEAELKTMEDLILEIGDLIEKEKENQCTGWDEVAYVLANIFTFGIYYAAGGTC